MYKALIIDDEKPVHTAIIALGRFRENQVQSPFSAYNGKDGLASMRELHPDIVFLDMNMPVMNGICFLEIASEEFPDTKFIVISGYDDFNYAHAAIKGGAIEYLLKPIDEEELNQAITKAVSELNSSMENPLTVSPEIQEFSPQEIIDDIKEYVEKNPLKVLESVYDIIKERKAHPQDGSYTNYLFGKGTDKILQKLGEECTEIVIAAKNPEPENIKYEISDFLYHCMVLMVEKGITWEEIANELAQR